MKFLPMPPAGSAGAVLTGVGAFGWCAGAAPVADGDCEIVPEKADGDAGSGAAGVEPGHAGENMNANDLSSGYFKVNTSPPGLCLAWTPGSPQSSSS